MHVKKILLIIVASMLLICSFDLPEAYAFDGIPNMIRIGLYFEKTGVASIDIKSQNGFELGYEKDGNFIVLMKDTSSKNLIVRKDAYFIDTGSKIVEYGPSDTAAPTGKKYGPYHIQIGKDYSNYDETMKQIKALGEKGLEVFPAFYNGIFKIWTGLYISKNEANKALNHVEEIAGQQCHVIEPSAKRVQVISAETQKVNLMFDSTSYSLLVQPIKVKDELQLIHINGKRYRGGVEFKRFSDSDMTVINVLDFEEYLYGVLPREMGGDWPLEALKAQAVTARTYALLHMDKYKKYGFNLSGTVSSQAYSGYEREHENCTRAVRETKGQVLTYNNKPAYVYFFSTSGGHTEDIRNVWGGSGYPYLKGVSDEYESLEKADRGLWEVQMTPQRISELLKAQGYDLGNILSVKVMEYSEAGRAIKLQIVGTKAERTFEKSATRNIFGTSIINSQYYNICTDSDIYLKNKHNDGSVPAVVSELKVLTGSGMTTLKLSQGKIYAKGDNTKKSYSVVPNVYIFNGKGWGHGVGMSQWGARGMAEGGFTYDQILMHYFPGTQIQSK